LPQHLGDTMQEYNKEENKLRKETLRAIEEIGLDDTNCIIGVMQGRINNGMILEDWQEELIHVTCVAHRRMKGKK
jgi:3-dehydroquinate synthase class II